MPLRVPPNQIIKSQYTSDGTYMFKQTQREYKGYYYEWKGKTYAGKEFNINNSEIVKINPKTFNKLLGKSSTFIYGVVSGIKVNDNFISSIPFNPTTEDFSNGYIMRYFIKKITPNTAPIIIKEVDKETFDSFKDPMYQTLSVKYNFNITDKELEELDKKMLGLKAFLQEYILPTSSNEDV